MSTVFRPHQKPRAVKNLGWLLRHWQGLSHLGFNYDPDSKRMTDGELVAKYINGLAYISDFASLPICWHWLDRSIFQGVTFLLVDNRTHEGKLQGFTIGDAKWKRLDRLEYSEFFKQLKLDKK